MVPVQIKIQASTAEECIKQAELVLAAGGKWIELCVASLPSSVVVDVSARLLKQCRACDATFCIVDDVKLCKTVEADGVCLTSEDGRVDEVREALGHEFIIGAVVSSFERMKLLKRMSVDYVRLCTSEELDVLNDVIRKAREQQLRLPICVEFAGALNYADAKKLIEIGADGIAINSIADLSEDLDVVVNTLLHLDN